MKKNNLCTLHVAVSCHVFFLYFSSCTQCYGSESVEAGSVIIFTNSDSDPAPDQVPDLAPGLFINKKKIKKTNHNFYSFVIC
jgi:hypothetical protein